jgi:zinc D-Ala-D-Ala carboxypeptidase
MARFWKYWTLAAAVAAALVVGTALLGLLTPQPTNFTPAFVQPQPWAEQIEFFLPPLATTSDRANVAPPFSQPLVRATPPELKPTASPPVSPPVSPPASPPPSASAIVARTPAPTPRPAPLRASPTPAKTPLVAAHPLTRRYLPIAQASGYLERYTEARPQDLVDYQGQQLTADTARAFEQMRRAALREGVKLRVVSGFRSIRTQINIFDGKGGGRAAAEYSAPPGHSQHHTGLAVDINSLQPSFRNTPAFAWLRRRGSSYGFMLSYDRGRGDLGPQAEPWHWVYVGKPVAMKAMAAFVARARQYQWDPLLGDRQLTSLYRSIGSGNISTQ